MVCNYLKICLNQIYKFIIKQIKLQKIEQISKLFRDMDDVVIYKEKRNNNFWFEVKPNYSHESFLDLIEHKKGIYQVSKILDIYDKYEANFNFIEKVVSSGEIDIHQLMQENPNSPYYVHYFWKYIVKNKLDLTDVERQKVQSFIESKSIPIKATNAIYIQYIPDELAQKVISFVNFENILNESIIVHKIIKCGTEDDRNKVLYYFELMLSNLDLDGLNKLKENNNVHFDIIVPLMKFGNEQQKSRVAYLNEKYFDGRVLIRS